MMRSRRGRRERGGRWRGRRWRDKGKGKEKGIESEIEDADDMYGSDMPV
jgi:hypothetical protein